MRVSPPAENQDYGSHVSPPPQDDTGGGGGVDTQEEGVAVDTPATTINFVKGVAADVSGGAGTTTVTVPGGLMVLTPAYAATVTIDLTGLTPYSHFKVNVGTLTGNIALNITNGSDGQIIRVRLKQDGTGGRTLGFGADIAVSTDVPQPSLTTTASKVDLLAFEWDGNDSKARLVAVVKGFA